MSANPPAGEEIVARADSMDECRVPSVPSPDEQGNQGNVVLLVLLQKITGLSEERDRKSPSLDVTVGDC